jgi:hypothetical protein
MQNFAPKLGIRILLVELTLKVSFFEDIINFMVCKWNGSQKNIMATLNLLKLFGL